MPRHGSPSCLTNPADYDVSTMSPNTCQSSPELNTALAMTWIRLRNLAALIVRGLHRGLALFEIEGAGKTGCLLHPRSRARFAQTKGHTSIQGSWKHSGLPCAMALRLTSCSPRRTALLPPSPREKLCLPRT